MTEALFISENYFRTNFQISDNVQTKFLIPAIVNAQEVHYQTIIGSCLYSRLCDGIINENLTPAEKELLVISKKYIGFMAMSELIVIATIKIDNIGANITSDENVDTLDVQDTMYMKRYYERQADFYAKRIQEFLLHHQKDYPELGCCDCHSIKKNLYSAASCGIWLGGPRGK